MSGYFENCTFLLENVSLYAQLIAILYLYTIQLLIELSNNAHWYSVD